MAEREGFEPSEPLRAQRFSRPPRSTTPAPLRIWEDRPSQGGAGRRSRPLADGFRLAKAFACLTSRNTYIAVMMERPDTFHIDSLAAALASPPVSHARFAIGDVVRHRLFDFRGVVFDVDPVFANSDEWYEAIPADIRPDKEQPFYHLLAENSDSTYVAYVSQQNLEHDEPDKPVDHPAIRGLFDDYAAGRSRLRREP